MDARFAGSRAAVLTKSPKPGNAGPSSAPPDDRSGIVPALMFCLLLASCAGIRPHVPPSEGHLTAPQAVKAEPQKEIPPPVRMSAFVPPPKPAARTQTYSVVVNEVPVKELLLALARDTKENIDIHSGLQGRVSLNAVDQTLPAILDRIARQVSMRYRIEANTIVVSPDTPYLRTYRINYVNMTRDTTSTISVTGEIAAMGQAGAGGAPSAAAGAAAANASSTVVRTTVKNDFWDALRENIRAILASSRARYLSAEEKAARAEEQRAARDSALKQAEAVARAGQGATTLFTTAFRTPVQQPPADGRDDIIVNPVTGTVSVLATEQQHQLIQQHVDGVTASIQRQVLIEATIAEVTLSNAYQGGIDWGRVSTSGGIAFTQALIGPNLATAPFLALFFNQSNQRAGDISFTLKLLQQFGNTRVLSSPKLMALNNQTALLKVVDNIIYFEVQAQTATTQGVLNTTFNTTPRSVSVGVVMGVTPQINEDGRVTLTVRPTISRIIRFVDDPNPSLRVTSQGVPILNAVTNRVPEIQVREMESVLQVGSGQTVILGGLMQDEIARSRDQLPGADRLDTAGELFRFRDERALKTELVIFLRPTVVNNPSLESDELRFLQRFLPRHEPPAAQTGVAP